jgi:glutamate dehydrogenase/leucine dehydrogenase
MENDFFKLHPQLICTVQDKSIDLLGYIVIDTTVNGKSCGGLRIHSSITIDELKGLARGMTLKYGFTGTAQGGAKAGIIANINTPSEHKQMLLNRFGNIIAPILKSNHYISGPDMGTTQADMKKMLSAAGVKVPTRRKAKGFKSGFFTALSVMIAAESAVLYREFDFEKCTVGIEGFGSVGSSLAWLFAIKKKAKIVAVSTNKGAIYNQNGLDVIELLKLRDKVGDELVNVYEKADRIEVEKLLTLDADILSPCAAPHTIYGSNAGDIKARIICPGANIPITNDAEKILFQNGITSVPYFVANYGGVIGNTMETTGVSDEYIEGFFRNKYRNRILNLLKDSEYQKIPVSNLAEDYAINHFKKIKARAEQKNVKNIFYKVALKSFKIGLIPYWISKLLGRIYFNRLIGRDD